MVRVALIIIRDKSGNFFVHQRNSNKKIFPNFYGLGAGGHVEENETSKLAAERELFEETGLKTPVKFLFKINYKDKENFHKICVYESIVDSEKISPDLREWKWSGWINKKEVDILLKENKLCPDTAKVYKKYDSVQSDKKKD